MTKYDVVMKAAAFQALTQNESSKKCLDHGQVQLILFLMDLLLLALDKVGFLQKKMYNNLP